MHTVLGNWSSKNMAYWSCSSVNHTTTATVVGAGPLWSGWQWGGRQTGGRERTPGPVDRACGRGLSDGKDKKGDGVWADKTRETERCLQRRAEGDRGGLPTKKGQTSPASGQATTRASVDGEPWWGARRTPPEGSARWVRRMQSTSGWNAGPSRTCRDGTRSVGPWPSWWSAPYRRVRCWGPSSVAWGDQHKQQR